MSINFALILIQTMKRGQNFTHVMTAQLLWKLQNCYIILLY